MAEAKSNIVIQTDHELEALIDTIMEQTTLREVVLDLQRVCRARAAKNYSRAGNSGEERFHTLADLWLIAAGLLKHVEDHAANDKL